MKATEQLASMQMMAVDPFQRVLAPRFLAGFIAVPLLTGIFTAVGILGGYLVAVVQLGVDGGAFWAQMQAKVHFFTDVVNGVVLKSLVFGVVANWIALFEGYEAQPTSEGISLAKMCIRDSGLTSIIVSHDVKETAAIADYLYLMSDGRVVEHGTPATLCHSASPWVTQFMHALPDGPVSFHYPAPPYSADLLLAGAPA